MEEEYHTIEEDASGIPFKRGLTEKNATTLLPAKVQLIAFSYNNIDFIDGFFESLTNQTLVRFDLTIVDLGSTDGTWEKIKKYVPRPGILFRWFQEPLTPFQALNRAAYINHIMYADGWVCPVNISDRLTRGALRNYLAYADKFPDVDLFYGNFKLVDDKEHANIIGYQNWPEYSKKALIEENFCGCSPLIKNQSFLDLGMYNIRGGYVADHELYIKMAEEDLTFFRVEEVIGSHYEPEGDPKLMAEYEKQSEDLKELHRAPIYNKP
jgi:glycosyltransferase involved in cell wall biosynthesis